MCVLDFFIVKKQIIIC